MIGFRIVFFFILLAVIPLQADEQPSEEQPLFLRLPFNRLTLTSHRDGLAFDVQPIRFETGRRPDPLPRTGELEVRFVNDPFKTYIVAWNDVERIELFHELVFGEFRRRLDALADESRTLSPTDADWTSLAARFELMFDYLHFLRNERESLPDYPEAYRKFLFEEAVYRIKAGDFSTGLARFERLHRENPNHPGLQRAWGSGVELAMEKERAGGNEAKCRKILDRLKRFYPEHPVAVDWENRLRSASETLIEQSKRALQDGDFSRAHRFNEEAAIVSPGLPEWVQWNRRLQTEAHRVDVAVDAPPISVRELTLDTLPDAATLRTRALLCRMLLDFDRAGPEGGVYTTSSGDFEAKPEIGELHWTLPEASGRIAYDAAETLLRLAEPPEGNVPASLSAIFSRWVTSIEAPSPERLIVRLHQKTPRPEALFAVPIRPGNRFSTPYLLDGETAQIPTALGSDVLDGLYVLRPGMNSLRNEFSATGKTTQGSKLIVEHVVFQSEKAAEMLLSGKVDLIDRIPPWQLHRFENDPNFTVGRYSVPGVHFLVPHPDKPLTADRTFRRALLYGLNRRGMLDKLLEKGGEGLVVSVPFVRGRSLGDSLGYAYDTSIQPRPYEPKLAIALSLLAFNRIRNKNPGWEDVAGIPELILAHPVDEMSRFAALMIRQQWKAIGLNVRLAEYHGSESIGRAPEIDFWLVRRNIREPLVDAERIFGRRGLVGAASPYMNLALDKLLLAEDWPSAARRLHEIHRLCFEETTVLPLWQMTEYYIHRTSLNGVDGDGGIVHPYQNLPRWSVPLGTF